MRSLLLQPVGTISQTWTANQSKTESTRAKWDNRACRFELGAKSSGEGEST